MKKSELFEALEPPPGGLTRLRARLSERRSPAVLSGGCLGRIQ